MVSKKKEKTRFTSDVTWWHNYKRLYYLKFLAIIYTVKTAVDNHILFSYKLNLKLCSLFKLNWKLSIIILHLFQFQPITEEKEQM